MLPQEGGFAIMLQETGIATRAQEMHVAAALRDKGYTAYFSSRAGGDGGQLHLERGGPPHRGQQQVRGGARGAQLHGNCPRESRGPGDPHGRGRPHPHQRPRAASRLLPVGGTGGGSGPTYKCMPRHAASAGGTRWSSPVTPTSTWMSPPTRPRSISERAGKPAASEEPRRAERRT